MALRHHVPRAGRCTPSEQWCSCGQRLVGGRHGGASHGFAWAASQRKAGLMKRSMSPLMFALSLGFVGCTTGVVGTPETDGPQAEELSGTVRGTNGKGQGKRERGAGAADVEAPLDG